jgi:large subunit ribosomal protein L23
MIKVVPLVTEKTSAARGAGVYVFRVFGDVNKVEMGKYIKAHYKVEVVSINSICYKGREKRYGRRLYTTKPFKKFYVKLADGQTISE